jgi:hypothetical protein
MCEFLDPKIIIIIIINCFYSVNSTNFAKIWEIFVKKNYTIKMKKETQVGR